MAKNKSQGQKPEEKKSVIEKVVEKVDHLIHPDAKNSAEAQDALDKKSELAGQESGPEKDQSSESSVEQKSEVPAASVPAVEKKPEVKKASSKKKDAREYDHARESADLKQHPKFDKFKKGSV